MPNINCRIILIQFNLNIWRTKLRIIIVIKAIIIIIIILVIIVIIITTVLIIHIFKCCFMPNINCRIILIQFNLNIWRTKLRIIIVIKAIIIIIIIVVIIITVLIIQIFKCCFMPNINCRIILIQFNLNIWRTKLRIIIVIKAIIIIIIIVVIIITVLIIQIFKCCFMPNINCRIILIQFNLNIWRTKLRIIIVIKAIIIIIIIVIIITVLIIQIFKCCFMPNINCRIVLIQFNLNIWRTKLRIIIVIKAIIIIIIIIVIIITVLIIQIFKCCFMPNINCRIILIQFNLNIWRTKLRIIIVIKAVIIIIIIVIIITVLIIQVFQCCFMPNINCRIILIQFNLNIWRTKLRIIIVIKAIIIIIIIVVIIITVLIIQIFKCCFMPNINCRIILIQFNLNIWRTKLRIIIVIKAIIIIIIIIIVIIITVLIIQIFKCCFMPNINCRIVLIQFNLNIWRTKLRIIIVIKAIIIIIIIVIIITVLIIQIFKCCFMPNINCRIVLIQFNLNIWRTKLRIIIVIKAIIIIIIIIVIIITVLIIQIFKCCFMPNINCRIILIQFNLNIWRTKLRIIIVIKAVIIIIIIVIIITVLIIQVFSI